jgi:lipooligosaccharide transport system permease protein
MVLIYAWRVLHRNIRVFLKLYKTNLVINFVEPSIYLFAFGIGLGGLIQDIDGQSYIRYIAPGVVCQSGLFAAAFESLYGTYTRMVYQKTFDAILVTPVNKEGLILGEIFYGAFKSVLFAAIIMIVVFAFRLIESPMLIMALPFAFIGGMAFSALSMIVTSFVKGIESYNYYITLVLSPLMLLSGIYFPLTNALETAGWFSPFFHTARICQLLSKGEALAILPHAGILIGMTAILTALSIKTMKRRLAR